VRRALALGLLALLGAAATPQTPQTSAATTIAGFGGPRTGWQRDYEKRFLALPRGEECNAILRELTRTPHLAGTPGNERVADWLAEEYRKAMDILDGLHADVVDVAR